LPSGVVIRGLQFLFGRVAEDIPSDVVRLVAGHIVSVEQLETLLLLYRERKDWTPESIAEALRTSAISATQRLRDLAAGKLIQNVGGQTYRYVGDDERLDATIGRLAATYAERPYRVIELIFSKPIKNLRVYADSFRFRKDEDDG